MPRLRSSLCTLLVICFGGGDPRAGASTTQGATAAPVQQREPRHDALFLALMQADPVAVQRIVSEDPARLREPVLEHSRGGADRFPPPLHVAARRNLMEVARVLLASGADPNGRDAQGNTPLHGAMMSEMVGLLVAAGADGGATNAKGETPLERMYWWRGPFGDDLARALIDAGGELGLVGAVTLGWTDDVERILAGQPGQPPDAGVLYRALRIGDVEIVDLLIAAGADVDAREPMPVRIMNYLPWASAVEAAIHRGHPEVAVGFLRAGVTVGGPEAARRVEGWKTVRGRRIHRGEEGDLLDRVVDQGCADAIPLLVDVGLDPARTGEQLTFENWRIDHDSRLVRAAWRGHADVVEALLEHDVDIDERSLGATALLAAAAGRHAALYDLLLTRGARTSIHAAAALGRADEVRSLVQEDRGRVDLREERCSWTPLAWAVHSGSMETVEVVLAAGAEVDLSIGFVSARPGQWDVRSGSLMPADGPTGPVVSTGGPQGATALTVAVQRGSFDIARRLIEAGARPEKTAVIDLCRHASPEATEILGRSLRNIDGRIPAEHWAPAAIRAVMSAEVSADERLVRFELVEHVGGAAILVDEDGRSTLSGAKWGHHDEGIARRLLEAGAPLELDDAAGLGWIAEIRAAHGAREITPEERASMLGWSGDAERVELVLYLLDTAPEDEPFDVHRFALRRAWGGRVRVVAAMVERGVLDLERDGAELLSRAAGARRPDLLKWLLANGVDVHASDDGWRTALHRACSHGSIEAARSLLAAGVPVDQRDRRGDTALLVHVNSPTVVDPSPELIGLLLKAGADPLAFGRRRPHALAIAAREARSNGTRRALRGVFEGHVPARYLSIFGDR